MGHDKECSHENKHTGLIGCLLSWKGVFFTLVLAAISYYLLTVHREHLAVALPYLFLLACPLMHIFGHGHGGHSHGKDEDKK
jgi:hypothetical protein